MTGTTLVIGTSVPGKLLNVPPTPETVTLGMPLRLATYSLGTDAGGTEAVGYGFEPAGNPASRNQESQ